MTLKHMTIALTGVALTVLCQSPPLHSQQIQPQKVTGKIRWIYNYADGKREAARTGKPMFVVFRCER